MIPSIYQSNKRVQVDGGPSFTVPVAPMEFIEKRLSHDYTIIRGNSDLLKFLVDDVRTTLDDFGLPVDSLSSSKICMQNLLNLGVANHPSLTSSLKGLVSGVATFKSNTGFSIDYFDLRKLSETVIRGAKDISQSISMALDKEEFSSQEDQKFLKKYGAQMEMIKQLVIDAEADYGKLKMALGVISQKITELEPPKQSFILGK